MVWGHHRLADWPTRTNREPHEGRSKVTFDGKRVRGAWPMREVEVDIPLTGLRLFDAGTGAAFGLGELRGVTVLSLIRHRY